MKIEVYRENISGIDLFMSFNINNRAGFSGTTNIPTITDKELEKQITIMPESNDIIQKVFEKKCSIFISDKSDNISIINDVLDNICIRDNIRVFIDIGGVFVGLTPIDVYNIIYKFIIKLGLHFSKFVYWDENDEPKCIDNNGYKQDWIGDYNINTYYYYDHKHTTGIDAKIINGVGGAVFLNKNSKRRDVVQGMFRMRRLKIGINDGSSGSSASGSSRSSASGSSGSSASASTNTSTNKGHRIVFIINKKLNKLIKNDLKLSNNESTVELVDLKRWFDKLEDESFIQQQESAYVQNIKSLSRNIGNRTQNFFYDTNNFKFFENKTFIEMTPAKINNYILRLESDEFNDIKKYSQDISSNAQKYTNNESIIKLVDNFNILDIQKMSINTNTSKEVGQQVDQQVGQEVGQEEENEENEERQKLKNLFTDQQIDVQKQYNITDIPSDMNKIADFSIRNYFEFDNDRYYANSDKNIGIDNLLYLSVNFSQFNNNDLNPSIVIYVENNLNVNPINIFMIPNIEGFKVIDYIKNSGISIVDDFKYIIFDTSGIVYDSKQFDKKEIDIIKSFIKIIYKDYNYKYLQIMDYINFILYNYKYKIYNKDIIDYLNKNINNNTSSMLYYINAFTTFFTNPEECAKKTDIMYFFKTFLGTENIIIGTGKTEANINILTYICMKITEIEISKKKP